MNGASVSVVIPTYNRGHLLARAIRSALAECDEGDEIIVVDDASTDNTAEVVAGFPRVTYLKAEHGGAGRARNLGIQFSKHPLVSFLDSDDEWLPGGLTLKCALLQARPELVFCFSNFAGTVRAGTLHHGALAWWHKDTRLWDEILAPGVPFSSLAPLPRGSADVRVHIGRLERDEMKANYVAANTVVVRKERAGEALWFPEDLPTFEDWECFGRLTLKGECAYLDVETAVQHYHPGPRLTDANKLKCATARITTLQRVWGNDAKFLRVHREAYEKTLLEQRKIRVRHLLATGSRKEALAEMSGSGRWPLVDRLLAHVPGRMTKGTVAVIRWLKSASFHRKSRRSDA
jgi:glycosyltransferase involved in cell wall biosynthesis